MYPSNAPPLWWGHAIVYQSEYNNWYHSSCSGSMLREALCYGTGVVMTPDIQWHWARLFLWLRTVVQSYPTQLQLLILSKFQVDFIHLWWQEEAFIHETQKIFCARIFAGNATTIIFCSLWVFGQTISTVPTRAYTMHPCNMSRVSAWERNCDPFTVPLLCACTCVCMHLRFADNHTHSGECETVMYWWARQWVMYWWTR